jgi:PBP1b-binding outer membrane lipoprotein LpoB
MLSRIINVILLVLVLAACVQKKSETAESQGDSGINKPLSEKCQSAKQDLDSAVQAGDRDNLHELKRNIEIYCVWRRY